MYLRNNKAVSLIVAQRRITEVIGGPDIRVPGRLL